MEIEVASSFEDRYELPPSPKKAKVAQIIPTPHHLFPILYLLRSGYRKTCVAGMRTLHHPLDTCIYGDHGRTHLEEGISSPSPTAGGAVRGYRLAASSQAG